MVLGVYAIHDAKVGFLTPTVEQNERVAIRNFCHAVVNSQSILSSFAKDFALYRIGTYDNDTGAIVSDPLPVHVYEAVDAFADLRGDDHA